MEPNKVEYEGRTLIDLTSDTVTEEDVVSGKTFHKANGDMATGNASYVSDVKVDGVSKVTEGIANIESTDTNDIDELFSSTHKVVLTNNGNSTYGTVNINGLNVYTAGTYEVNDGDTITFKCYGRSTTNYGDITIDGTEVLRVVSTTATNTYSYVVHKDVSVTFNINTTSRYGRLTVTTSSISNPEKLVDKESLYEYYQKTKGSTEPQTKNTVYAAPDGVDGQPSFRPVGAMDIKDALIDSMPYMVDGQSIVMDSETGVYKVADGYRMQYEVIEEL